MRPATWLTGVHYDSGHPVWRAWWDELSRDNLLVRYDQRGCGSSDRNATDFSLEARVRDLEAVVDQLGLDRIVLLGHSHGVPVSIAYAAQHPEKVDRLLLLNGFARGPYIAWQPRDVSEAVWRMVETSWHEDRTRRLFAVWNMPDATPDVVDATVELLKQITSRENIVEIMSTATRFDVSEQLKSVTMPALVMQSTRGEMNPAEQSRELAALLPNAISVDLESRNHILLPGEPAWRDFLGEFRAFMSSPDADLRARKEEQHAHRLSSRELQVLRLIAEGKTDRAIGHELSISSRTVSNHVKSILSKSATENRAHAVAWAAGERLL